MTHDTNGLVPDVPPGCKVVGRLYDDPELAMGGTQVEVQFPGDGPLICADWSPEDDPAGGYFVWGFVRDSKGKPHKRVWLGPTLDKELVLREVERIAKTFAEALSR